MQVVVIGKYIVPLMTNDEDSHEEQISKAVEQASYTIKNMPAKQIKAEILQHLSVEISPT